MESHRILSALIEETEGQGRLRLFREYLLMLGAPHRVYNKGTVVEVLVEPLLIVWPANPRIKVGNSKSKKYDGMRYVLTELHKALKLPIPTLLRTKR